MRQRSVPAKEPAEQVVKDIRRATRRHFSSEDKIRIVLEGLRGEDSIAELCRREGIDRNRRINRMQSKSPMHLSPRCGAQTRSGSQCKSPAMPNGRCRMHGGMSPGAPKGNKNAFKHGHYAAEAIASRREIAKLLRDARALVKQVS